MVNGLGARLRSTPATLVLVPGATLGLVLRATLVLSLEYEAHG